MVNLNHECGKTVGGRRFGKPSEGSRQPESDQSASYRCVRAASLGGPKAPSHWHTQAQYPPRVSVKYYAVLPKASTATAAG